MKKILDFIVKNPAIIIKIIEYAITFYSNKKSLKGGEKK